MSASISVLSVQEYPDFAPLAAARQRAGEIEGQISQLSAVERQLAGYGARLRQVLAGAPSGVDVRVLTSHANACNLIDTSIKRLWAERPRTATIEVRIVTTYLHVERRTGNDGKVYENRWTTQETTLRYETRSV